MSGLLYRRVSDRGAGRGAGKRGRDRALSAEWPPNLCVPNCGEPSLARDGDRLSRSDTRRRYGLRGMLRLPARRLGREDRRGRSGDRRGDSQSADRHPDPKRLGQMDRPRPHRRARPRGLRRRPEDDVAVGCDLRAVDGGRCGRGGQARGGVPNASGYPAGLSGGADLHDPRRLVGPGSAGRSQP